MSKTLVQEEFGKHAKGYLTSKPHAKGKSLDRMVTLAAPKPDWRMLDIATGAGHVAYAFAPHVASVCASDITEEMLDVVRAEAQKRGLSNLRTTYAKAEDLPFPDASFELVTCRIAPHHFDSIARFLDEVRRVLTKDGVFALVDNVVPAGVVGDYINAFERFRDPSHLRAWPMAEWRAALTDHEFTVSHEEELYKTMEFDAWAGRHDANMQAFLRALITRAAPEVNTALAPGESKGAVTFQLCEGLFIARPA